jgi:hypothetical protein
VEMAAVSFVAKVCCQCLFPVSGDGTIPRNPQGAGLRRTVAAFDHQRH